jgi:hypothetical protein
MDGHHTPEQLMAAMLDSSLILLLAVHLNAAFRLAHLYLMTF